MIGFGNSEQAAAPQPLDERGGLQLEVGIAPAPSPTGRDTFVIDRSSALLGRNKAWFCRKDENGRQYLMAFVNAKGSCSVRTFDAERGIFLGKHYRSGSYQDQFSDLLQNATELTVESQPNLERDCKERLPERVFLHLRKQIP